EGRLAARDVRRDAPRRLSRLRRGGARHGSPRLVAEDQGADAGRGRQVRSRDATRGERIHQEPYPWRAVYGSRGGPYFQCRAGGRLYQGGAGILARQIGACLISLYPRAARNSCGVVPVCLRKKRAKWDGSEKARSYAISWIGWLVNTSWRFASVSTRWRIRWPAVTPVARLT